MTRSDADKPLPITIELVGGLGNQLFQYGAGLAQAQRLSTDLILNIGRLKPSQSRSFELAELAPFATTKRPSKLYLRRFGESGFAYDQRVDQVRPGTFMRGYFQSWKYLTEIGGRLKDEFQQSTASTPVVTEPHIALQVRRGDYLNPQTLKVHGICSFDYFERSLKFARSKLGNLPAVVFGDDAQTAADFAGKLQNALVDQSPENSSALETLHQLSFATAHIISNSSFGWWGSWLSPHSRMTIAPRPWFSDNRLDTKDLLPTNWITFDRI